MELLYVAFLFWMGGLLYQIIEVLWGGNSHWTMFIAGGICETLISYMYKSFKHSINIVVFCIIAGAVITLIEFITGLIVNVKLKWKVWDYSHMKNNIMGQVCLEYSFYWVLLSVPAIFLSGLLSYLIPH